MTIMKDMYLAWFYILFELFLQSPRIVDILATSPLMIGVLVITTNGFPLIMFLWYFTKNIYLFNWRMGLWEYLIWTYAIPHSLFQIIKRIFFFLFNLVRSLMWWHEFTTKLLMWWHNLVYDYINCQFIPIVINFKYGEMGKTNQK